MSEPLVIIGNGMAAARLCEELAQRALGRYAIAVIGEEPRLAYNRVLLSSVLAGEVPASDIALKPAGWWRDRGVTLCYGAAATAVDIAARAVTLADGQMLPFAKLVFATGSRAIRLPIAGAELPGVLTFRDLADVARLPTRQPRRARRRDRRRASRNRSRLRAGQGRRCSHTRASHGSSDGAPARRARAALMLKRAVEAKGIEVLLEAATSRFLGDNRVEAVEFKDGRVIAAEMAVVAVGIRPNASRRAAGLAVNRGIVVNDHLSTSTSDVFAIGECAEHRGICYGLVEPANEQAHVLAERLAGREAHYGGSVNATNLKVSGVHVFSAGDFLGAAGHRIDRARRSWSWHLPKTGDRRRRLVGAVLYGDTADAPWYLELIRSGARSSLPRGPRVRPRAGRTASGVKKRCHATGQHSRKGHGARPKHR